MITERENVKRFYDHQVPDHLINGRDDVFFFLPREVQERGPAVDEMTYLGGSGYDWFGVHWTFEPEAWGAIPTPGQTPVMTDVTKWKEQVKFPDISGIDWQAAWDREKQLGYDPDRLVETTFLNGPFERLHALMGFEEALVAVLLEPEAVKEFAEAIVDFKIKLLDDMLEVMPLDIIEMHDDLGHQRNSFMSPEQWEPVFGDAFRKMTRHCKEKGLYFQLHSCGKIDPLIPSLIETGVEHWSSCQPVNDIRSILHNYGDRLTIWQGREYPTDFPQCEGQDLNEAEFRQLMEDEVFALMKGGAFTADIYLEDTPDAEKIFNEMFAEKRDTFYKDPESCKLP